MKTFKQWISLALCLCTALTLLTGTFTLSVSAAGDDMAAYERRTYLHDAGSPMDDKPQVIKLTAGGEAQTDANWSLCLDGTWKMLYSGSAKDAAAGKGWDRAIDAPVPGSVYTALEAAGVIDPVYTGKNMVDANRWSSKSYYLQTTFTYDGKGKKVELDFDGLCNVADIYLNGNKIASHEGMFGGPWVDVTNSIKKGENTLMVHLHPAKDYNSTVVFNCSYGWHYAKLYPLGIWQSVTVRDVPSVEIDSPFVSTADAAKGTVDLAIDLCAVTAANVNGTLTGVIAPKNFEGKAYSFEVKVTGSGKNDTVRLRTDVPDPHLWWPGGYGAQDLYTLTVTFKASDGSTHTSSVDFGIRSLSFEPFPGGANTSTYNRTCVINGKKIYLKGAGWCTIDALMHFTREDYDRILSRAHAAGINYVRAWGGGLVETEEFYDLCDEYGICVYQEWPCCWDSSRTQPADVLYETVTYNTKRLRSRASLIVWGGGNEGTAGYDDVVLNKMGRLTYELDGTRPFWRQDGGIGGGGITHDHIHWSGASPEHYVKTYSDFKNLNLTEYGLDGMMNLDSIARFATEEELNKWPLSSQGTIAYHTSTFNGMNGWSPTPYGYDVDTFIHYANQFIRVDSLEDVIIGSQLAQAVAGYLPALNARMNFPYSTANVVYKMNDVAPHSTWAIVDWYGAPKLAFYLMQDAYEPLTAAVKLNRYNTYESDGTSAAMDIPVYVLDDVDALAGSSWSVTVTAYGESLQTVKQKTVSGQGSVDCLKEVATLSLTSEETAHTPLILTVDLSVDGALKTRTYAYLNFESEPGSLFYLPRTTLSYSVSGDKVTIRNTGSLPAVSVYFDVTDSAAFVCEDNYFLLTAGESVTLTVNDASLIRTVKCFNLGSEADKTAPSVPQNTAVSDVGYDTATLKWDASTDETGLFGYYVYLNGKETGFVQDGVTAYTFKGLSEVTEYHVTVEAADNGGNRSGKALGWTFTTAADPNAPSLLSARIEEDGSITAVFDRRLNKADAENVLFWTLSGGASVTGAELTGGGKEVSLTVSGMESGRSYTLGVVGLTGDQFLPVRMPYTELLLDNDLYLAVSFDVQPGGACITAGQLNSRVDLLNKGEITPAGTLMCGSQGGAIVNGTDFNMGSAFTVSMVYNGNAATNALSVLFAKGPKTNGHFEFYSNAGNLLFYAPEIGDINLGVNMNVGAGRHTLTFVYKDGTLCTWIDGVKKGSTHLSGKVTDGTAPISFGCLNDGSLPYAGQLDDIRLYTRALTDDELSAGAAAPAETGGYTASGNQKGKTEKSDFTFKDGEAVNLWFKADGFSGFNIFFAKSDKSTNKHFELYTDGGDLRWYAPSGSGGNMVPFSHDMRQYVGAWHMLTLTHVGQTLTVYIDGTKVSSLTSDFNATEASDTLAIGRLVEGGFDFSGSITEFEIYPNGITEAEMAALLKAHEASPTVTPGETEDFAVSDSLLRLLPGTNSDIVLTLPNGCTAQSSDESVAVVDNGCRIKALALGTAVITVRNGNTGRVSAIVVDVVESLDEKQAPGTTPVQDDEPETTPGQETDTGSADPTQPSDTDPAVSGTSGEGTDTQPAPGGCRSAVGFTVLLMAAAAALVFSRRRR